MEHDARVPFPEDLPTAKYGNTHYGEDAHISTRYDKGAIVHAPNAGERTAFTMHSFRSGGPVTQALAGEDLPTVVQRAFLKKPSTAWRYLRLVEVLIPGSVGNSMVTGVSPEQYREF